MLRLGPRILKARSVRNITQTQAAASVGVTQSTWSDWENDAVELTWTNIQRIAKVLRTPVHDLVCPARTSKKAAG